MPRPNRQRDVTFRVQDDHLEMHVSFAHQPDRNYMHRCSRDIFREVAYAIEDHAAGGTALEQIVHATNRSSSSHFCLVVYCFYAVK